MPPMLMKHEKDPKQVIFDAIGDLSNIEVCYSQILVGIYKRPQKTANGILLTEQYRDEENFQGKAVVVLKKGPLAFKDTDDVKFNGFNVDVGQWIVIRASDGFPLSIHGAECRLISDALIRMVIQNPDEVW